MVLEPTELAPVCIRELEEQWLLADFTTGSNFMEWVLGLVCAFASHTATGNFF